MHQTQEKGAVTPQETDPDLPVSVQESLAEAWGGRWPAVWLGALSVAFIAIIFIASIIVWPQVKQHGGDTAPTFNRKLD